jgi:hypothetical protein
MKIRAHADSHVVELDDGSCWQIFPGDLSVTLHWTPETELTLLETDDAISSHVLSSTGGSVRVIPAGQQWPVEDVKAALKNG